MNNFTLHTLVHVRDYLYMLQCNGSYTIIHLNLAREKDVSFSLLQEPQKVLFTTVINSIILLRGNMLQESCTTTNMHGGYSTTIISLSKRNLHKINFRHVV